MSDKNKTSPMRVLLVDDELTFGEIMKQEARIRGVNLIVCVSLLNPHLLLGQKFDVAIVDFDLGIKTGPELGKELVEVLGNDLPVLLISQKERVQSVGMEWPKNIKAFVNKDKGFKAIMEKALLLCKDSQ